MKQVILFFAVLLTAQISYAQNTFKATIQNEETKQAITGAKVSVRNTEISATTDASGKAELTGIPDGEQIIEIFADGYEIQQLSFTFPLTDSGEKLIFMKINEVGDVVINTTRTGREIDDTPTRVEAIDEEEVDEKSSMRSANVSMILNESTGIKVQQTSATSFTQSIRIQGLDGRYTQILKDGFPAFGGFSGSLSLLDIPPLDLQQVEIIKGASSTFYGAGAIAGVVNFISKEPTDAPVTSMIFNQTSALGTDFSIFNSRKFDRIGYTFLGSVNYQKEYDVDDDDFTELPNTKSFNINPRVFFYADDKTRLMIGNSTTYQNRKGGDVFVIRGSGDDFHQYFEKNNSIRNITTLQFDRDLEGGRRIVAKQSIAFFNREIEIPDYSFKGRQFNSYTDISYFHPVKNHALIFGFNAVYDQFKENSNNTNLAKRNETRTTVGGYVQDSFDITNKLSLEAGFRLDAVKHYGVFALPRVSLLYRFTDKLSSRASFGLGYKAPSIFTEEAETLLFQNVLPIGNTLKAERSSGGTFDVNYRNTIGEKFSYSVNQMFFYTKIQDPLVLLPNANGAFSFTNAGQPVKSSGFETNVRASYDIIKLFAGYTYTNAKAKYLTDNQFLPLTPKSKLNSALLFEKEENFKVGFEAYYTGSQFLSNRFKTKPYWVLGIFGEKSFGNYSLFINAENITDTRQSRFGQVVFPLLNNPTFSEIYTHTEGRVFNGGIKIRL
ncbi:MAG: TonB-dependent receptor [Acidobacteria bacterium]|nr:TonB-dependent receptor [Acidobacteriota bacterium]MCA1638041.1 TonB-dependent receptor [Acidobacteriota bacterium]